MLAEVGSVQLELAYLSHYTNDTSYYEKSRHVVSFLHERMRAQSQPSPPPPPPRSSSGNSSSATAAALAAAFPNARGDSSALGALPRQAQARLGGGGGDKLINGLYPVYIDPSTGLLKGGRVSFGSLGDSWYSSIWAPVCGGQSGEP